MKVALESVGNPDFGQHPDQPLYGCDPNITIEVDSFEMASAHCQQFIQKNELGGGNWSGGLITDKGKKVAYVSYNGAVWKIEKDKPMYSGENEKIKLNPELMKPTVFSLIKKAKFPSGKNTVFHYQDQDGRKFIFKDTDEPWEYKLLTGTHEDFHSLYALENMTTKFIRQGIRQHDYKGGYDEAIKTVEVIL